MATAIGFLILSLSYLSLSHGLVKPRRISHGLSESGKYLTRDELWFNQTLDHFSPYVINQSNQISFQRGNLFQILCVFAAKSINSYVFFLSISGPSQIQTAIL